MVRFTDLPDEILLQIISYYTSPPLSLSSRPFPYWPGFVSRYRQHVKTNMQTIISLTQSNARFYNTLYPIIYSNIFLDGAKESNLLCISTIDNVRLGQGITTVYLRDPVLETTQFLFFLPNVHTVYIAGWHEYTMFDQDDDFKNGDSPVTSLHLSNCGAYEKPLKQLLRWPKALKELWYEASQVEWEDDDAAGFTCSAISRALEPVRKTLEKFVFTREDPGHEGLFYSDAIDLRNFSMLKELEIFHVLLVGYQVELEIWRNLPPSLESLGVWYDDTEITKFMVDSHLTENWLTSVLQRKRNRFPKLGKIRVVSIEWFDDYQADWDEEENNVDEDEEEGNEDEDEMWRNKAMPTELKKAFVDAGVSYSVHLQETAHCWKEVVEGGTSFDEDWDEKEIADITQGL